MRHPKILLDGDPRLAGFPDAPPTDPTGKAIVGWREWVGLPGLGIARATAKIDTGARTSALHVDAIKQFDADGVPWLRFGVTGEADDVPARQAPMADRRWVRSSNGEAELRFVIRTELRLAGRSWPIEITLTNRERMELPMLIGREALAGRALVDAAASWLCGAPAWNRLSAPQPGRAAARTARAAR